MTLLYSYSSDTYIHNVVTLNDSKVTRHSRGHLWFWQLAGFFLLCKNRLFNIDLDVHVGVIPRLWHTFIRNLAAKTAQNNLKMAFVNYYNLSLNKNPEYDYIDPDQSKYDYI